MSRLHSLNSVQTPKRVTRAAGKGGAGKCVTCAHPDLAVIDAELVAGVPYQELANRYGMSRMSLLRHHRSHTGQELAVLTPVKKITAGMSALERVEAIYAGLYSVWQGAEANGQVGVMVTLARELRPMIEL